MCGHRILSLISRLIFFEVYAIVKVQKILIGG
jgi:hypothetical protein